ncbi:class I SAM-dependent methyltransferase [Nitrospirota bacterium]
MSNKKADYYRHVRTEILPHILKGENRVLDIGCAEGYTGAELKRTGKASFVAGIELDISSAQEATKRLDHVITGDVQTISFNTAPFLSEPFDYLILSDVLEHLSDPWSTLQRLVGLLRPGGKVIVSIPNIRNWRVLSKLIINDDWHYQSDGILDFTHLRFFTLSTSRDLLIQAGLNIEQHTSLIHWKVDKLLNICTFGLLSGFFACQWLFICTKQNGNR